MHRSVSQNGQNDDDVREKRDDDDHNEDYEPGDIDDILRHVCRFCSASHLGEI